MKVTVHERSLGRVQAKALPTTALVRRLVAAVLSAEKVKGQGEITIIFVNNRVIRDINRVYLNHDRPTDVIAFPYEEFPVPRADRSFGDIYISVPVASDNARRYGQPVQRELGRLVVHGLLHILGYTDHKPREKANMWSRQERILDTVWAKTN